MKRNMSEPVVFPPGYALAAERLVLMSAQCYEQQGGQEGMRLEDYHGVILG